MGGRSGKSGVSGTSKPDETQQKIDSLRQQMTDLMQQDYTGRKGWADQLESRVNKAAKLQKQIDKLERQKSKQQTAKKEPAKNKPKSTEFKWQRAGEGWYVGKGGFEIRENDSGGFDVVKVKGNNATTVKSFSKLSQARKYNPT